MSVSDLLTVNALTGPGPGSKVTGCSERECYPDLQTGSECLFSKQTRLRTHAMWRRGEPGLMALFMKRLINRSPCFCKTLNTGLLGTESPQGTSIQAYGQRLSIMVGQDNRRAEDHQVEMSLTIDKASVKCTLCLPAVH